MGFHVFAQVWFEVWFERQSHEDEDTAQIGFDLAEALSQALGGGLADRGRAELEIVARSDGRQ
mgnify:CR=1 FL=1